MEVGSFILIQSLDLALNLFVDYIYILHFKIPLFIIEFTLLISGSGRSFKYKASLLISFIFEFLLSEIYVIVGLIGFCFRETRAVF